MLRVFSNIFNNSYTYTKNKIILVESYVENRNVIIEILDQGLGFSVQVLNELRDNQKVTNPSGNGIGLSSMIDTINKMGGKVEISNRTDMSGAKIRIEFPEFVQSNSIVLIDDNILISMDWKSQAKDKGITINYFNNIASFKSKINSISTDTPIYIDSELGNDVKGELEARGIFEQGFQNITLVTSHPASHFESMPWIKEIKGKEFPYI